MTGLGDLVAWPSDLAFFFLFFVGGSSLGSRAALLKLLRLLELLARSFTSEAPPSLARLLLLLLDDAFPSPAPLTVRLTLSSAESSNSDVPVVGLLEGSGSQSRSEVLVSVDITILKSRPAVSRRKSMQSRRLSSGQGRNKDEDIVTRPQQKVELGRFEGLRESPP